jgi:hypothetical protein
MAEQTEKRPPILTGLLFDAPLRLSPTNAAGRLRGTQASVSPRTVSGEKTRSAGQFPAHVGVLRELALGEGPECATQVSLAWAKVWSGPPEPGGR